MNNNFLLKVAAISLVTYLLSVGKNKDVANDYLGDRLKQAICNVG